MKYILLCILTIGSYSLQSQDFYDLSTVQKIEITFAESNWDALLDAQKNGAEDYILAQSVSINGSVFDSVGVKYKGNSTYNANQNKNPFHIELDTYKDHDYQGYKDIKLSNVAKDPSFLREVLSYQILGKYMDAPLSNYANVYVNGTLIGLYSNSEAISKRFVNDRFGSKTNTFVKCNPPAGAGPGSNNLPTLEYKGEDSSSYYTAYELKSDYGWNELIDLCDTLSNHSAEIESLLDVDRTLWMLAFNNALVNLDSYIGGFAQNYYLYRSDNNRFIPIVWDLNESFGGFTNTGSGNLNSTAQKQNMSHLLHQNDIGYPLIQKLLNVPIYKRMYVAHLKTIMQENFDDNSYYQTGLMLQNVIKNDVQADNNKFYTYNNFISNLDTDISGGGGGPGGGRSTVGITNLMDTRNSYLLALPDFTYIAPSITNISVSNDNPLIGESVIVTAEIADENAAYLGYKSEEFGPFKKVLMYDDGAHNDGNSNDGIYGVDITLISPFTQFYIYADNDGAGLFSPRRAEHEYYGITATTTNPTVGDIVINEFMASNSATQADDAGDYDDWVELYNNSNSTISLDGYYMSDDASDPTQWAFPIGTNIEANGYLIVWADKDEDQGGLHADFKLSADGETIILSSDDGVTVVDEVTFTDQAEDISYGRFPNGTGPFQTMNPTFGRMNTDMISSINTEVYDPEISIYPNPANLSFTIKLMGITNNTKHQVSICDMNGRSVYQAEINHDTTVSTSLWTAGMYIIRVGSRTMKLVVF